MGAFWGAMAAVCIGLTELFGRRLVTVSGALSTAAAIQVVATLSALVSVGIVASELSWRAIGLGAVSGLGLAVGLTSYFKGLEKSSATVVSPTTATLAAVIPFVYTLLRGSEASWLAIAGAGSAFVGLAIIAAGDLRLDRLRSGLIWGGLSGLGYGVGTSVLVDASDASGAWPAVAQRGSGAVVLVTAALLARSAIVPPVGQRLNGLRAGTFAGLTSVFALIGLTIDPPATVVTQAMFPVASVIVGFAYFGDSVTRRQLVGITMALAGIVGVVGT